MWFSINCAIFSGLDPCPFKFWQHPWKVSESLFIKQNRPKLNVQNQEYKNRERNAGNAGNRGDVIFQGMLANIPGNAVKHSWECHQTFHRMLRNILENVLKHSGICCQTFRGMLLKIPQNAHKVLALKFNGNRAPKHVTHYINLFIVCSRFYIG